MTENSTQLRNEAREALLQRAATGDLKARGAYGNGPGTPWLPVRVVKGTHAFIDAEPGRTSVAEGKFRVEHGSVRHGRDMVCGADQVNELLDAGETIALLGYSGEGVVEFRA